MSISALDLFPIGHVIETVDTSFNPNNSIGGTWQLNHSDTSNGLGYVLVSQDDNDADFSSVGQVGGVSTVAIGTTNYPAHTHTCRGGFIMNGNRSAGSVYGSCKVNGNWGLWSGYIHNGGSLDGYGTGSITFPNQASASGTAHNNLCAYRVVNRWVRTA